MSDSNKWNNSPIPHVATMSEVHNDTTAIATHNQLYIRWCTVHWMELVNNKMQSSANSKHQQRQQQSRMH